MSMDTVFAQAAESCAVPGAQAVIIGDGESLWCGNYGDANLNQPSPVSQRTHFAYGSVGKLLLTVFTLHQVELGVLDLDEPISAYLGTDVACSHVVTIRMLLTHTAGYPDIYSSPAVASLFPPEGLGSSNGLSYDPDRPYTWSMLSPGISTAVDPGARWEYSNTGFIILARVLTRLLGGADSVQQSFMEFARRAGTIQPLTEDILTMRRTDESLARFAHGYSTDNDGSIIDCFTVHHARGIPTDLFGLPFGDGAFAGTALGAAQFLNALFVEGRLLRQESMEMMIAPTYQSRDVGGSYGMGTSGVLVGQRNWQGHPGQYIGFTAMAATDLASGITIAVLTNKGEEEHSAVAIWRAITETYIKTGL